MKTIKKPHAGAPGRDEFNTSIDHQLEFLENLDRAKPPVVEQTLGFQIGATTTRLRIEILRKLKEHGYDVTPVQGIVLKTIETSEGVSQRELADRTVKDKPTITRILDILEKKNLIRREPDSSDRRIYKIYLTARGKEKIEFFETIIKEIDRKAFRGITAREKQRLQDALRMIRNNLDR